jgi:UDP-N-acetylmuramoyl-tripeptide--D-alanyl-D-alanine ligase
MAGVLNTRSLAWISRALGKEGVDLLVENGLGSGEDREWSGAAIDSRSECAGRLFFALHGEKTDGHRFVAAAYSSGCAAAVVDDGAVCPNLRRDGIPYLLVSDSRRALQELARTYRATLEVRVIAITGSAGKTTTKEYVRRIMKSRYRVFANPGNFNSMIGVPVTILETGSDNEYLVSEVGANQPGEVGFLSAMLRPEIGVITNVGDAHLGMFGTVENIARAKAELLDNVAPHGYAVLPRDDPYCGFFAERNPARTVTFGRSEEADFVLRDVGPREGGGGIAFKVNDAPLELAAVGEYNALNACAAFAVGEVCGVEPQRIRAALAESSCLPGRGRVHLKAGVTVVDESYNASPASMSASLSTLQSLESSRRVAVLGDMKELGTYAAERHRSVGERLAALGTDAVFWLGEWGPVVREGYQSAGGTALFRTCASIDELVAAVGEYARPGDAVLVKASRAVGLDVFVAGLLELLESNTEN